MSFETSHYILLLQYWFLRNIGQKLACISLIFLIAKIDDDLALTAADICSLRNRLPETENIKKKNFSLRPTVTQFLIQELPNFKNIS